MIDVVSQPTRSGSSPQQLIVASSGGAGEKHKALDPTTANPKRQFQCNSRYYVPCNAPGQPPLLSVGASKLVAAVVCPSDVL